MSSIHQIPSYQLNYTFPSGQIADVIKQTINEMIIPLLKENCDLKVKVVELEKKIVESNHNINESKVLMEG